MAAGLSGELSFLVFGEPAEAKAFVDVAKGFQEANPGVTMNTDAVPSQPNHLLKLATAFAAGDPPDVWVIDYRRFGLLQNAGVVEAAQPYLEKSTVIKASDFYTKPLRAVHLQRGVTVHADEYVEPGGLLQQRPLRQGQSALPEDGLDLGRFPARRPSP